jgi:hypothetical protein
MTNQAETAKATDPWETAKPKIKKNWFGIEMADRMVGMRALDRSHRLAERLARKTQDGTLGKPDETPEVGDDMGEDMGVQVGDNVVNHYYPPPEKPAEEPLPVAEKLPAEEPTKTLLEKAAPYLLATALAGVPGGSLATYFLTRPDPTPPPAVESPAPGYEYTGRKFTPGQE